MNVLFTGSLNYQLQLSEVLSRLMEEQPVGLTALRLADEKNGSSGHIYISDSRYVCGADLIDANQAVHTGYDALKILCGMVLADFTFIDGPEKYFEHAELTLHLEMPRLIEALPHLPDDPASLQNKDSLLDRIFSPEMLELQQSTESISTSAQQQSATTPPKSEWHSVDKKRTQDPEKDDRYTTLEQRAHIELDPQPESKKTRKQSPIGKGLHAITFSLVSTFSALGQLGKLAARPILIVLLVTAVGYQTYRFSSKFHRQAASAPAGHQSVPHVVRAASTYHPQARKPVWEQHTSEPKVLEKLEPVHRHAYQTAR